MALRFSQDIKTLLQNLAEQPLSLDAILAQTSERGFSLVIGLLVLPFLLPMPPGLTGPLGAACFLLAVQMALGRRSPWLPKRVAKFRFPRWFILRLLNNLQRVTRLLEKITRRRWLTVAEHPQSWRLNGLCMAWLTILLILPIPLTNPIPTMGILLFVVATLEGDGLLMCISYGFTILITLGFAVLFYLLWQTPTLFSN